MMHLKIAIAGNVIASVPLNGQEARSLEYIYTKKSLLTEACSAAIFSQTEQPVYYIEVPSKMNKSIRK